jgi:hypothetical protein
LRARGAGVASTESGGGNAATTSIGMNGGTDGADTWQSPSTGITD